MHCYQIVVSDIEKLETQCGTIIKEIIKVACNNLSYKDFINHAEDLKWYILAIKSMDMLDTAFVAFFSKLEIEIKIVSSKIANENKNIEYDDDDDEYDDDTQYKYDRDAGMIDHVDYFLH